MSEYGNHEQEQEMIVISNEEGQEETFQVLFRFEQDNGYKYILLTPVDQEAGDDEVLEQEVYPFRYDEDGDNINLTPIEEESEWDMIEEVLNTLETELNAEDE